MSAVALASTLHDPTAADLPALRAALPDLAHRYARMVIYATEETPDCVLEPLRAAGAAVSCHPGAYSGIGGRRLGAVREAATYAPAVHLCDFDRLLHWHHHYPDELTAVLARISQTDLLLLGRTERAWATHPAQQIETEQLANRVVSRIFGADVDICSGSRGLSRRAIDYLAAHSRERSVGTDGEWPVLLLRAGGLRWDQLLTEGLEFETADRYQDEVARAGGLAAWNAARDRDAAGWTFRVRLAGDIILAALRAAE
ncbi:MAG: hypothetical protein ACTHJ9_10145 [Rhodanobacter sp.]